MKVENKLKVFRAMKDVTQEELGQEVELSRQTINAIEKGKFLPSIYSALKIANYFNVSVEEIFYLNTEGKNDASR